MASYTSYLSNILTHTTSRYNSLRKILLSNEDDGDTEDDSHISRVLRAYYTEKGQPFPPWLPADPNDRRNKAPPPQQTNSYFSNPLAARNPYSNVQQSSISNSRGSGSLNDLWDAPNAAPAAAQSQSLRAGRRAPAGGRQDNSALSVPQARPLPSQRAGSYQNTQPPNSGSLGQSGFSMDPQPSPGGSAQDRLKARLWGRGGSQTNVSTGAQGNPYAQPPQDGNPYAQPPPPGNAYDQASNGRRYGRTG